MTATLLPTFGRDIEVRLGNRRPGHMVYLRRRVLVALIAVALIVLVAIAAGTVLADRGTVPASSPTIRPAPAAAQVAAQAPESLYVVQAGDTLWAIAEGHHGSSSVSGYLDRLIERNGGTHLQIGQALTLP